MLVKAGKHAEIVAANILIALERDEAKKSGTEVIKAKKEYKGFPEIILITFGPVSIMSLSFLVGYSTCPNGFPADSAYLGRWNWLRSFLMGYRCG